MKVNEIKKVKQLFFELPELLLIALTAFYWISSGTFLNPVAIGLLVILIIQFFLRNELLGVVIPILIVMGSIYLLLALFSEFGEFQVKDANAHRLLVVGIPCLLATIASSVLMIRKYTKANRKGKSAHRTNLLHIKNLVFILFIWLALGCQQSSTSSSSEPENIEHEAKSDFAHVINTDSKDKQELFYEKMIGEDFAIANLTTIDNEVLSSSFLKGKVVFLNFWYKNCSPCIAEMEGLKELQKKYDCEKSVFIMVTWENSQVIQEIQKEYGLSYKMVSVARDSISNWGIQGYPSSFILDKTGKIVYARIGGQEAVQKATEEVMTHFGPVIKEHLESIN